MFNQEVPFKKDFILKVLEDQNRRSLQLTVELLEWLCELLGMASQLAKTESSNLSSIEAPAILLLEDEPIVYWGIEKNKVIYSSPRNGLQKIKLTQFTTQLPGGNPNSLSLDVQRLHRPHDLVGRGLSHFLKSIKDLLFLYLSLPYFHSFLD